MGEIIMNDTTTLARMHYALADGTPKFVDLGPYHKFELPEGAYSTPHKNPFGLGGPNPNADKNTQSRSSSPSSTSSDLGRPLTVRVPKSIDLWLRQNKKDCLDGWLKQVIINAAKKEMQTDNRPKTWNDMR